MEITDVKFSQRNCQSQREGLVGGASSDRGEGRGGHSVFICPGNDGELEKDTFYMLIV